MLESCNPLERCVGRTIVKELCTVGKSCGRCDKSPEPHIPFTNLVFGHGMPAALNTFRHPVYCEVEGNEHDVKVHEKVVSYRLTNEF